MIDFPLNEPRVLTLKDPLEPRVLTLKDPLGDLHQGQLFYQTMEGVPFSLPAHAGEALSALGVHSGEEISICRYQREHSAEWVIALTPRTEKARATKESELENQLRQSLEAVQRKGVMPSDTTRHIGTPVARGAVRELRPTGTDDSPAPQLKPRPVAKGSASGVPPRVSYRIALQDITKAVTGLLRDTGEQWNDQAKQDLISTAFISAAKTGQIVFDFPSEAA